MLWALRLLWERGGATAACRGSMLCCPPSESGQPWLSLPRALLCPHKKLLSLWVSYGTQGRALGRKLCLKEGKALLHEGKMTGQMSSHSTQPLFCVTLFWTAVPIPAVSIKCLSEGICIGEWEAGSIGNTFEATAAKLNPGQPGSDSCLPLGI